MGSQVWVVSTLLISIVLIVLTIVKLKFHPFLALLLASFFVGAMMGMGPLEMVNAIESGIGGTLGFLAAVIGLGTILGKMMEVSGAAERIGLTLQRCRWLSADVIMVLVGLICGITLFVEVGVVLLIPLAFSIAKKTNTSLLKLAIPLCTALMAVHCVVPPHPAALFVANKLGADIGTVIVYGLLVGLIASLVGGPLFLRALGNRLPYKPVPAEFANLEVRGVDAAVARRHAVYRTAADWPDAGENRRRTEHGERRHAVYGAGIYRQPHHRDVYRRLCRLLHARHSSANGDGRPANPY